MSKLHFLRAILPVFLLIGGICTAKEPPAEEALYKQQRERMVQRDIAPQGLWGRDAVRDKAVLEAMGKVPRQEFVAPGMKSQAYADSPLPIGHGQTISQPYIVAKMTELLNLGKGGKVLEVGSGSGYHAAVVAEIADEVYTIEIVKPLAEEATERLKRLGYDNVQVRYGDGYYGWPEKGPFDGIIVTAAASHIPPPLIEQLKPGGRMVIPVGPPFGPQQLVVAEKKADGALVQRSVMGVRFVPFTRGAPPEAGEE